MDLAAQFLKEAWLHQLRLFQPNPVETPQEMDSLAEAAYLATVECLSGGQVLELGSHYPVGSAESGEALFTHTDHYAVFLIELMRVLGRSGEARLASETFALNKALHSINVWVDVEMPAHYRLAHCVGTVIGKASLGDNLFVGHGCTIGASTDETYPILGNGVSLRAHSAVLGRCRIGDNVAISAATILVNTDVPSNSLVVTNNGNVTIVPSGFPQRFNRKVFGSQ